jgi:hypothetical protein
MSCDENNGEEWLSRRQKVNTTMPKGLRDFDRLAEGQGVPRLDCILSAPSVGQTFRAFTFYKM